MTTAAGGGGGTLAIVESFGTTTITNEANMQSSPWGVNHRQQQRGSQQQQQQQQQLESTSERQHHYSNRGTTIRGGGGGGGHDPSSSLRTSSFVERSTSAPPPTSSSSAAAATVGCEQPNNFLLNTVTSGSPYDDNLVGNDLLQHMSDYDAGGVDGLDSIQQQLNNCSMQSGRSTAPTTAASATSTSSQSPAYLSQPGNGSSSSGGFGGGGGGAFLPGGAIQRPLSAGIVAGGEGGSGGGGGRGDSLFNNMGSSSSSNLLPSTKGLVRSQSAAPAIGPPPGLANLTTTNATSSTSASAPNQLEAAADNNAFPHPPATPPIGRKLVTQQQRSASTGVIGGNHSALRPSAKTLMDLIQEDSPNETGGGGGSGGAGGGFSSQGDYGGGVGGNVTTTSNRDNVDVANAMPPLSPPSLNVNASHQSYLPPEAPPFSPPQQQQQQLQQLPQYQPQLQQQQSPQQQHVHFQTDMPTPGLPGRHSSLSVLEVDQQQQQRIFEQQQQQQQPFATFRSASTGMIDQIRMGQQREVGTSPQQQQQQQQLNEFVGHQQQHPHQIASGGSIYATSPIHGQQHSPTQQQQQQSFLHQQSHQHLQQPMLDAAGNHQQPMYYGGGSGQLQQQQRHVGMATNMNQQPGLPPQQSPASNAAPQVIQYNGQTYAVVNTGAASAPAGGVNTAPSPSPYGQTNFQYNQQGQPLQVQQQQQRQQVVHHQQQLQQQIPGMAPSIAEQQQQQQYVSILPQQGPGGAPQQQQQITYWPPHDGSMGATTATTMAIMNATGGTGPGVGPVTVTRITGGPQQIAPGQVDIQYGGAGGVPVVAISGGRGGGGGGGGGGGRSSREKGGGRRRGGANSRRGTTDSNKSNSASQTSSSPLLEEFRSMKSRDDWTMHHIVGHVVEFCQDQNGSRFIQQRLELGNVAEQQIVVNEVCPAIRRLRNDVFGNYVVQKLFDFGSAEVKAEVRSTLEGEMLQLSLQMYGCRVVQKALEALDANDLPVLLKEFHHNVLSCIHDQNGNHVIQKCIEVVSKRARKALEQNHDGNGETMYSFLNGQIDFILSDVLVNTATLSCHPYGCRVLQRILEHCEEDRKTKVLDEIMNSHKKLLDDQYGNYVIQHVLQFGRTIDRDSILAIVAEAGLLGLSRQKFASNVVEKLLKYGNGPQRCAIVREMLKTAEDPSMASNSVLHPPTADGPCSTKKSVALLMVRDAYANYVVQTTLDVVPEASEERMLLLEELNAHSEELRQYTFAKHIVAKLTSLNNSA